jgi:hypothetical protein
MFPARHDLNCFKQSNFVPQIINRFHAKIFRIKTFL